jgi:hypothetical protein
MKPDFFYECEVCKDKIPANWPPAPDPVGMQSVVVQGKGKTETTFRCEKHHTTEG